MTKPLKIGVVAIQGDFDAHRRVLGSLGAKASEVRTPGQLVGLDGLVIPGGESTTIAMGMEREGLDEAIPAFHQAGGPILGSCAGMIVCDREHLGLADYVCRRNAFGRQLQSFEQELRVDGLGEEPLRAVFIRAPWIEERGPNVEVLAEVEGHPVAVRDDNVLAVAFHPELTDDSRLHASFMAMTTAARRPEWGKGAPPKATRSGEEAPLDGEAGRAPR
jgi:5'-phosphate synthase pdxT subunit